MLFLRYAGWASMSTLEKHKLIMTATSKCKRYGLTEKGRAVAKKCYEEYDGSQDDFDDDQGARNYSQPSHSQLIKTKKSSHSQPTSFVNSPSGNSIIVPLYSVS